jgi:hypothetical protein
MIDTNRHIFELLCKRRGCALEDAMPCVVSKSGNNWTVDENHPAFPKHRGHGLGDRVAAVLSAVGITPERVSKALGRPCGCKKRQARLNELGRRLGIG